MSERSDSPSRLTQIFSKSSKSRRSKKGGESGSASNSIISTDSDGRSGVRGSVETAIEKLKDSPGSDNDNEGNGIKRLVPKAIANKRRRKKQEKEDELRASEEAIRGRSVAERGTLLNESQSSLQVTDGDVDGGSSLMTYDSVSDPDS